jgi:hypothetical protein
VNPVNILLMEGEVRGMDATEAKRLKALEATTLEEVYGGVIKLTV